MKRTIKLALLACLILLVSTLMFTACNIVPVPSGQQTTPSETTPVETTPDETPPEETTIPEETTTPEETTIPEETTTPEPHLHTEEPIAAVEPTCTKTGLTEGKHCVDCGEILVSQEIIPALGHTEVIDKAVAPTCTTTGLTDGKHCSACGEVIVVQETVRALGHTEVFDKAVAPTCTTTGLTEGKHCSVCSKVLVAQTVVNALGHTEIIDEAVAPTCSTNGLTIGTHCFVCGEILVVQEIVPTIDHEFIEILEIEPTCTEYGFIRIECKNCDYFAPNGVSPLGHTEVIDTAVAPTCTATGLTEGKHCSVCNEVLVAQETVNALGHTEIIDEAVAPTCSTNGLTIGTHCSVCNEILIAQEVIPQTNEHEFIEILEIEPTCTEPGFARFSCKNCDYFEPNALAPIEHTEVVNEAVAPTCTETGLTEGKHCSICNEVIVAQETVKALGHTEVFVESVSPTCTTSGKTEGKYCLVCGINLVGLEYIEATGHTWVIDPAVEATCAKPGVAAGVCCSDCGTNRDDREVVYAVGHNYGEWVVIKEPTLTEEGLKVSTCACGITETRSFGYHGDYGYTSLASMTNGSNMQALYNAIDKVAVEFHSNTNLNAVDNIVGTFDYYALGLTCDEAIAVWKVYKYDHPLYYWISPTLTYNETTLFLLTDNLYAKGSDRAQYNQIVYEGIQAYAGQVSKEEGSPYLIALAFHDKIILSMEYAYELDGVTPQDDVWAHNILGVFEKKTGVCEAYAKTFQLLLNYCGVENIYVSGTASGEDHAWNLAKMDDGNWYWFDLTRDDKSDTNVNTLDWLWGIWYNYFCVNDTKDVASYYVWHLPYANFLDTHIPETPSDTGIHFLYPLPARSDSETIAKQHYSLSQDATTYEHWVTVDGIHYNIVGYNVVMVADISLSGEVVIPERITYNGRTYEVIAIDGIGTHGVTSVTIPKTVKFISGPLVLNGRYLEEYIVDKDNPYFTAQDGVLFTKNLYTLISYPFGNKRTEYAIPDEVYDIAEWAFGISQNLDFSDTCNYLSTLFIGANVGGVGRLNDGWGYRDQEIVLEDGTGIFGDWPGYVTGQWVYIYKSLKGEKQIIISKDNPHYFIEDGILYSGQWMLCVLDETITSIHISKDIREIPYGVLTALPYLETITVDSDHLDFFVYDNILYNRNTLEILTVPRAIKGTVTIYDGTTIIGRYAFSEFEQLIGVVIPDSVTTIDYAAFINCSALIEFTIPNSVTDIGESAFRGCSALTSITIPNSVTRIDSSTFLGCTSLTSITIPDTVTEINGAAFWECTALTSLNFEGTMVQWDAISLGEHWKFGSNITQVICSDGIVTIN